MRPQSNAFLIAADRALSDARVVFAANLPHQAARLAYYAQFHAAQSLIFERTGRIAKTHKGVGNAIPRVGESRAVVSSKPRCGTFEHVQIQGVRRLRHRSGDADHRCAGDRRHRHGRAFCCRRQARTCVAAGRPVTLAIPPANKAEKLDRACSTAVADDSAALTVKNGDRPVRTRASGFCLALADPVYSPA